MHGSVNWVSIGSDNGLLPIQHQAIIWTNAGLLSILPLGTKFSEILTETKIFINENASENIVCEMAAILSRRWVEPGSPATYCTGRINSSPPGQNGCHFADDIFRCIFVNEKFCILIKISLKFIPKGAIYNNPALVQIMAWRRIGDKPLSELMLTRCTDTYMRH